MQTQTRQAAVQELSEIYTALYANEPADSYDMDGAREYWRQISPAELAYELENARRRLQEMKDASQNG